MNVVVSEAPVAGGGGGGGDTPNIGGVRQNKGRMTQMADGGGGGGGDTIVGGNRVRHIDRNGKMSQIVASADGTFIKAEMERRVKRASIEARTAIVLVMRKLFYHILRLKRTHIMHIYRDCRKLFGL